MSNYDALVAKRALAEGLIAEDQLHSCLEIEKACQKCQLNIPLSEIILQKIEASFQEREIYLKCLVKELQVPELALLIDPFLAGLSEGWEKLAVEVNSQEKDKEILSSCLSIQKDLQGEGIYLSLEHLYILRTCSPKEINLSDSVPKKSRESQFNITTFCQRQQKNEILPLKAKVAKLSGKILDMQSVDRLLKIQKEIFGKWSLDIPFAHLAQGKYKIDPYLLYTLMMSQLSFEEGYASTWAGGIFIEKREYSKDVLTHLFEAQNVAESFLEWSFKLSWLSFSKDVEKTLVLGLRKYVSNGDYKKAEEEVKILEDAGFSLPPIKFICLINKIPHRVLLATLVENIYSSPNKVIYKGRLNATVELSLEQKLAYHTKQKVTKKPLETTIRPFAEKPFAPVTQKPFAPVTEKPLAPVTEKSSSSATSDPKKADALHKQLSQTMALPMEKKISYTEEGAKTLAASRILNRLKKMTPLKSEERADKVEEGAEEISFPEEKAPVQKVEIQLNEDMLMIKQAVEEKYINEEIITQAFLKQFELQQEGNQAPIFYILLKEGYLNEAQYSNLQNIPPQDPKVLVTRYSNKVDLVLANILINYNILPRDRVQNFLRLQSALHKLDIIYTLEELLVKTKTLASDMVRSLLEGGFKRAKEARAAKEQDLLNTEPIRVAKKKNLLGSFVIAPLVVISCLGLAFINFVDLSKQDKNKNNKTIDQTPVVVKRVEQTYETPKGEEEKSSQEKTFVEKPREEKIALVMEARNKEKWGEYWVSAEEKKRLEQQWKFSPGQEIPVILTQKEAQYLKRGTSYGIVVEGELSLPPFPKSKRIRMVLQLLDITKTQIYEKKKFSLSSENSFKSFLGPFPVPLAPGRYHLELALEPDIQNPLVRDLLNLKKRKEWLLPLSIGSLAEVKSFLTKEEKNKESLLVRVSKHFQSFQEIAQKKRAVLNKDWPRWKKEWLEEDQSIKEELGKTKNRYVIPIYPKTYLAIDAFLEKLKRQYSVLEDWREGLSLLPLDISVEMSRLDLYKDKLSLLLKKEKDDIENLTEFLFKANEKK